MSDSRARSFFVFGTGFNNGAVLDDVPEDGPAVHEYLEGRSLRARYPGDATISFSPECPKLIRLLDSVSTAAGVHVLSSRVKQVLERLAAKDCEFLPVTLLNHRGKVASKDHFLLNVLRLEDVIDMKRSRYTMDAFNPGQIDHLKELHLAPDRVSPDAHVFRATTKRDELLLDDVTVAALEAAGATGLRLFPAEGWDGISM